MLFGNYWHGGVTTVKDASGTTIETITYPTAIPTPENTIWKLTTVSPNTLVTNGYSNVTTSKGEMRLTLAGTNITVSSNTGSTFVVEPPTNECVQQGEAAPGQEDIPELQVCQRATGTPVMRKIPLPSATGYVTVLMSGKDENPSHY